MDKIIIRNAFHYFDDASAMLAAIRVALKPDGLLYMLEYPKSEAPSTYSCSRRMTEAALYSASYTKTDSFPSGNNR